MHIRKIFYLLVVVLYFTAIPALAEVNLNIDVGTPPPVPVVETIPSAVPAGYVWAPGYWGWENGRHVWVKGDWIRERPGYVWAPGRWEQHGEKWHFVHPGWNRGSHEGWDKHDREHHDHDHDHDHHD